MFVERGRPVAEARGEMTILKARPDGSVSGAGRLSPVYRCPSPLHSVYSVASRSPGHTIRPTSSFTSFAATIAVTPFTS